VKFDFSKPVHTLSGQPVKLLTIKGREVWNGKAWPITGYIGDSIHVDYWDAEGVHQDLSDDLKLVQDNYLYINLYANGTAGTYHDIVAARSSAMRVKARIAVPYTVGQCDF